MPHRGRTNSPIGDGLSNLRAQHSLGHALMQIVSQISRQSGWEEMPVTPGSPECPWGTGGPSSPWYPWFPGSPVVPVSPGSLGAPVGPDNHKE